MAGTNKTAKETLIKNQQKKQREEYARNGAVSRQSDIAGYSAQTLERYGIDSGKVLGNTARTGSSVAGSGSGRVKSSKEDFISAYRDRTAAGMSGGAAGVASGTVSDNWKRGILTSEQAAQREMAETSGKSGLVRKKGTTTSDGYLEYASIPEKPDYSRMVEEGKNKKNAISTDENAYNLLDYLSFWDEDKRAMSRTLQNNVAYMTDTEKNLYYYLNGKYGAGVAADYVDTLHDELNRRGSEKAEELTQRAGKEMPVLSAILEPGISMVAAGAYPEIALRSLTGETIDTDDPIFGGTRMSQGIREGIKQNEGLSRLIPSEGVRSFAVDTGMSIADNIARLPFGNAGLAFASGGAGVSGTMDALGRGANSDQAFLSGAAQGAAEAFFEKFSLEGLRRFQPGTVTSVRSFLKNMGKQAFTEGSEEFFTEAANTASDAAIMGGLSDYSQNIRNYRQEYIGQGIGEEEADKKAKWSAFRDFAKGLGLAIAGGALSGGIMGGGAQGLSLASEYAGGRSFNPDFRDYAQGLGTDAGDFANAEDYWRVRDRASNLQKTAEEYAARQANGETVNPILRSRFKNDLEGYMADVAESQARQQERQAQGRTDAEEFIRQYRERQAGNRNDETAAGPVSANYEGNTGTAAENGTAAPEVAQNRTQEPPVAVVDGRTAAEEVSRQAVEQMSQPSDQDSMQEKAEAYAREQVANGQQTGMVEPGQPTEQPVIPAGPVTDGDEGNTGVRAENGTGTAAVGQTGLQEMAGQYAREVSGWPQGSARVSDEQLDLYGEDYGAEGRKAFREAYRMNEGTDIESYYRAFARQYNTGRYNRFLSAQNRAEVAAVLTQEQMAAAYRAGARDRNAEIGYDPDTYELRGMRQGAAKNGGLMEASALASDAQKRVADAVGKKTGLKIYLMDDMDAAGAYGKGTVRLSVNAQDFNAALSHELTHFIQDYSAETYQVYQDRVVSYLEETQSVDLEDLVRTYQRAYERAGQDLSRAQAMDEIVADATETFLNDPEYLGRVLKEEHGLRQRIIDFISDVIDALKELMHTGGPRQKSAQALAENVRNLERCRDIWLEGLDEAGERYASGMELGESSEGTDERFKLARPDQVTDEQIEANYQAVREMEPVAELTGEEFARKEGKLLSEQVLEFYNSVGNKVTNDVVGDIMLTRSSVKDDTIHKFGRLKAISFAAVPDVLKQGKVLHYSENWKNRGYRSVVIGGKIHINSGAYAGDYYEACVVVVDKANRMYLHEVYATKTDGSLPIKTGAVSDGMPGEKSHLPLLSIFEKLAGVNSKEEKNTEKVLRYQLENVDDYEAQINDLLHENEELRSANEMLKREFDLTSKDALRQEDVHKVTGKILKKYNSELNQGILDRNVGKLYEYIRSSERVDGRELSRVAADIGRSILMQSKQKDTTFTEQYKELRNYIKNSAVMISEQDRKDLAAAGGYNEFRKKYFGKIKLGNKGLSVDSFYEQLNELDPNWFDLNITHPADRLMTIAGFLDATDAQVRNPYHANMDEMSYLVGQELLESYFDVRSPKPTFADRQAQEAEMIRRDYSRKMAEYKKKISNRYEALLAERDRDIARTKDIHAQELLAQKAKYEKQIQSRRESLRKREAKTRIIREVNTMRKWLLSPTDTKHVPQQLRTVMADFLGAIDFSSKEDISGVQTQRTQLWLEAKAAFDQIANAGGMITDDDGNVRYLDLDPDLQERFGEIAGKVKDLDKLENLDAYTLEEVYKTVLAMKKAVTEVDSMKSNARYRKTSLLADEVFENLDGRKTKTEYTKWAGMPGKLLNYDMVDPLTMFNRMGPAFGTMYDSLRSGLDKKTQLLKEAEDYFRNAMEENGFTEKDVRKLTGMNADVKEFALPQGKLRLSVAQIMSLYELDKRGQAQKHIYDRVGGIRPADRQTGFSVGKDGVRLPKLDRAEKPLRVSKEQVRMITDTLTPEQKQLADAMQRFMGDRAAAWGNEVSMEMYGYEKFTAQNYFPIRTDQNYVFRDENGQAESTIKNLGMTKSTNKYANNPIIIEDIFDVFTRQADQMSSYNAYVLPLSDLHKVMNYKDMRGNAGGASIQDELQRVFGKDGRDYIDKLVKDINGSVQGEKGGVSDALLSNFKAASVAGNLRVAIQQPTAIARVYAEMDLKYLAKGTVMPGKGKWDLICKYAPIAQWKDWGFYRMQTSRQMKDVLTGSDSAKQRFVNRTMILAEKGDQVAWERLWNACEAECGEKYPELEKGSEDFYRKVGKRFSDIVDRTQVADSILHRTQIMRNTNGLVKMATSFMGEPLKSYNMLYRAAMELNDAAAEIRTNGKSEAGSRKETAAGRKLARAGVAFVANAGLTALAASVMDAMRDSDRDKDWLEKYQENVRQNFLDNINILNNIPYVKEIPSIFKGYTPTRSDLSAFTDIYNVCKKWEKFYAGTSKQTFQSMIMETAQAASKITGIPVKSIVRDATALLDTVFNAAGGEADYQWMRQQYAIGAKGNRRMYADMILDSEERGDNKLAQQIREDLLEAGFSEDDIVDSINSAVNARIEDEVDIIGAAESYDAYNKESVNVFKGEVDKYIYYKMKAGWDEEKCLKQVRTSLTNEYKPKWKAAKTQEEKDAIIKKCKSFYYNGDSIFKDYDFKKNWKDE